MIFIADTFPIFKFMTNTSVNSAAITIVIVVAATVKIELVQDLFFEI